MRQRPYCLQQTSVATKATAAAAAASATTTTTSESGGKQEVNNGDTKQAVVATTLDNTASTLQLVDSVLNTPISGTFICYLVALNVIVFHVDKLLFNLLFVAAFCFGFALFVVKSDTVRNQFDKYMRDGHPQRSYVTRPRGFIQIDPSIEAALDSLDEAARKEAAARMQTSGTSNGGGGASTSRQQFEQQRSSPNIKPSLTGSYIVDDELHKIIELFVRDYIDSWYKTISISSDEEFPQLIRVALYNAIRNVDTSLKSIDWEHFIMNILAHNLVIQMRLFKKAKEKQAGVPPLSPSSANTPNNSSNSSNSSISMSNNMSPRSSSASASASASVSASSSSFISIQQYAVLLTAAQSAAAVRESHLVDAFFDLEAEIDKGVCRDTICAGSAGSEREQEFLQEISEIICYSLLSPRNFNCLPLRYLMREILANVVLKVSIDNITDPDYINQTLLYWCQDEAPDTENFLVTVNNCDNIDELHELRLKIDDEILRTRSYDKGGEDDQEIKLKLSSLQYVKRRIDARMSLILQPNAAANNNNSNSNSSSSGSNISGGNKTCQASSSASQSNSSGIGSLFSTTDRKSTSSDEEFKSFLFNQHLADLDFSNVITNETIQHCFIEYMGKQSVQNLISFYLNADMYRQFARKELLKLSNKQSALDENEIKMALKDFAKGLINSYLLSAVNFMASSQDEDDQPVNIANRIFYKAELIRTVERLESAAHLNESLLDELQAKIFLLMKQKYFADFKNYSEFLKLLHKNDFLFKLVEMKQQQQQQQQQKYHLQEQHQSEDNAGTTAASKSSRLITNPLILSQRSDETIAQQRQTQQQQQISEEDGSEIDSVTAAADISLDSIDSSGTSSSAPNADDVSQSSFELYSNVAPDGAQQSSSTPFYTAFNFRISAEITSSGRCNELKSTYAIYIIDVKKEYDSTKCDKPNEFWQTYRRFNDFYDLHLIVKKKCPGLGIFALPGKSFRNSLSDEFLEKRRTELNKYLQSLCSTDLISSNPQLLPLVLKFLENKRWENSQTNFKRRVDSILTPMISSVQTIQTSIKNAPDNMLEMVKGISDNIITNTVDTFSKINPVSGSSGTGGNGATATGGALSASSVGGALSPTGSVKGSIANNLNIFGQSELNSSSNSMSLGRLQMNADDLNAIDKTILNADDIQSNNLPIRVLLLLIDEVFDLKEKKQWLRQSLMAIVKSFMRNFKGESMNRKIKEQIADYLSEEYIARYIKNFRKRTWPNGFLADAPADRTKSAQQLTKILAKTKLLALVSDELRTILGADTTRRGMFDLFDLLQHRAVNKRLLHILLENLLVNFFQTTAGVSGVGALSPAAVATAPQLSAGVKSPSANNSSLTFNSAQQLSSSSQNSSGSGSSNFSSNTVWQANSMLLATLTSSSMSSLATGAPSPLNGLIRLHLCRSGRVKSEWRQQQHQQHQHQKQQQQQWRHFASEKINKQHQQQQQQLSMGSGPTASAATRTKEKTKSASGGKQMPHGISAFSIGSSSSNNSPDTPPLSSSSTSVSSYNLSSTVAATKPLIEGVGNNPSLLAQSKATGSNSSKSKESTEAATGSMSRSKSLFSEIQC